jgi:SAM-dependent methyltransferase
MTKFPILDDNKQLEKDRGIWTLPGHDAFEYSDGDASEEFLKYVVTHAKDVSSQSMELEKCHADWDWVSEYHLSSKRANILRGFSLEGIDRALELGCGCGAITRYLGEKGLRIDAVEGSRRRAEIAQQRCRDLDNVHIVNANYNALNIPAGAYDAVFLVGVLEYAKKFLPEVLTVVEAVQKIISVIRKSLREGGLVFIALENRMGLKYFLGATEDHYGRPYIGLYDYSSRLDIQTFDKNQWEKILSESGVPHHRFAYPFPDYKLPKVLLSDHYIANDPHAHSLLYQSSSRDYLSPWQTECSEFPTWRSLHKSGYLEHFANSVCVVLSDSKERLDRFFPYDFAYFPDLSRKPSYRCITVKPRNEDLIIKEHLYAAKTPDDDLVAQKLEPKPYLSGPLLSTFWVDALVGTLKLDSFEILLKQYYEFVLDLFNRDAAPDDLFDVMPSNIIVGEDGAYKIIDKEWLIKEGLTPEYLLFRSLAWLVNSNNRPLLLPIFKENNIENIKEFVAYGFNIFSLTLDDDLETFIALEERIQATIGYAKSFTPVKKMLAEPFQYDLVTFKHPYYAAKLFWADEDEKFRKLKSLDASVPSGNQNPAFVFKVFNSGRKLSRFKFQPTDHSGLFDIKYMVVNSYDPVSAETTHIWQLDGQQPILEVSKLDGMVLVEAGNRQLFWTKSTNPSLVIEIPETVRQKIPEGILEIEIEMEWPQATDVVIREKKLPKAPENRTDERDGKPPAIIDSGDPNVDEQVRTIEKQHSELASNKHFISEITRKLTEQQDRIKAQHIELYNTRSQLETLKIGAPPPKSSVLQRMRSARARRAHLAEVCSVIKQSNLFDADYYLGQYAELKNNIDTLIRHYVESGAGAGLKPNPLFDTYFYIENNPELIQTGQNPLYHYILDGARAGRKTSCLFDTRFYLEMNRDVIESDIDPLLHFITKGGEEGRCPHILFDIPYYVEKYGSEIDPEVNPLVHFLETGFKEGFKPHRLFDTGYYLKENEDVAAAGINPLIHFIEHGYREERQPNPLFDLTYYMDRYLGGNKALENPLIHYVTEGATQGNQPNRFFDSAYYLVCNGDVAQSGINPLGHYIEVGDSEGRKPCAWFDPSFYRAKNFGDAESGMNTLLHYMDVGADEGCDTNSVFDRPFYIDHNPDARDPDTNALHHYLKVADNLQREFNPLIDTAHYLANYPDASKAGMNPLVHYLDAGVTEKVNPNPWFDAAYYLAVNLEAEEENTLPLVHYRTTGARKGRATHAEIENLAFTPQISIVIVVSDDAREGDVAQSMESVASQLYNHLEVRIIENGVGRPGLRECLEHYATSDERFTVTTLTTALESHDAYNHAISECKGDFVLFLDTTTRLRYDAVLQYVQVLNGNDKADFICGNCRNYNKELNSIDTFYKPELLLSLVYHVTPFILFRKSVLHRCGGLRSWHPKPGDHDFILTYLRSTNMDKVRYISENIFLLPLND